MGATATFPTNASITVTDEAQLWSARRQRSQELKQLHEPDWLQYWAWYRNVVTPLNDPADWWRSNESIPTVFKIIETLLPRYIMGMFESPEWFNVEGRNFKNEQYEQLVKQLLRTTIDEMELFPKLYDAMRYAMIMGHCWGKIVWREDYETRQILAPTMLSVREAVEQRYGREGIEMATEMYGEEVLDQPSGEIGVVPEYVTEEVYNAPDFEWLTLDRVFPDPSGRMRYVIEEIHITLEEIEEIQDKLKIYDSEALNDLRNHINLRKAPGQTGGLDNLGDARSGTTAGVSIEYAREPETTEGIPEWLVTPMRDGTGVSLWQCWGWVPEHMRGKDGVAWRLQVLAEGKFLLRNDPSPTPDGKPPYFPIKSISIPGRQYGESILKYVGPLADQQTRLANMRLDEVFLGVWQQYLFRKNAVVSDNALLMQPGGAIEVNPEPNQTIQDTFMVLPRRPVMPEAYQEDQYRQVQAEHAAAASDIMQGVSGGDRSTATEVERRLQQGSARHLLQVMYNDYTVKREILKRTWQWLQMRMPTSKMVKLTDGQPVNVDLSMIQIPVDIVVGGGMDTLSKEARLQMDQELIQITQSEIFAPFFKPVPILRKWLLDRGFNNPDAYLKTEEEINAEQMAQQQMAQQEMAIRQMEAQAGGGGQRSFDVPEMLPPGQDAQLVGETLGGGGVPAFNRPPSGRS